jgi:predicted RNase H-like nuclease
MSNGGDFVGLDGCRAGWIRARWPGPGGTVGFDLLERFDPAALAEAAQVGIDIPIGLPSRGRRACDLAARAALPAGAKSRVFLDLRRPLLDFADYPAAGAWAKAEGHGLSKQAWFVLPKVREVDEVLAPADQARIRETHPEVLFHRMSAGRLLPNKASAPGRQARMELLAHAGVRLPDGWDRAFRRSLAKPDDLLDAAACALAARLMARGALTPLPLAGFAGARGCDARGLRMEIWG